MELLPDNKQKEIFSHFEKNRVVYMGTCEGDQPRVRPVTLVPVESKFWILTGTSDAKIKHLKINSRIEVCYPVEKDENTGYIRLSGEAKLIQDIDVKRNIVGQVSFFNKYWDGPEDPDFTLIQAIFERVEYLEPGELIAEKYSLPE